LYAGKTTQMHWRRRVETGVDSLKRRHLSLTVAGAGSPCQRRGLAGTLRAPRGTRWRHLEPGFPR